MSFKVAKKPELATPPKPKIVLYGAGGVGKTWTSIDFPSPLYIDTEGGATFKHYTEKLKRNNADYIGVEEGANDLDFLIDTVRELITEKHEYKTLIIDSISKPWNQAIIDEADRLGDKNGFGADRKPAISKMRKLTNLIEKLDMNVIIIAHEKGAYKDGESAGMTFDCYEKLGYDLNLTARIVREGKMRFLIPSKSRMKSFKEDEPCPFNIEELTERFEREFGKGILDRKSMQVVLASEEEVARFQILIQQTATDEKLIKKWFRAAKCDEPSEMTQKQILAIIKSLETKKEKLKQL